MKTKRVFIGIPVPPDTGEALFSYMKEYKDFHGIKWTTLQNLHVTVCFIGQVAEEEITRMNQLLPSFIFKNFVLEFEAIRPFTKRKTPDMIWATFRENIPFTDLSKEIHHLSGIPLTRPPLPHVTLGRIKTTDHSTIAHLTTLPVILPTLAVNKIIFYESLSTESGVKYLPLKEYFLHS